MTQSQDPMPDDGNPSAAPAGSEPALPALVAALSALTDRLDRLITVLEGGAGAPPAAQSISKPLAATISVSHGAAQSEEPTEVPMPLVAEGRGGAEVGALDVPLDEFGRPLPGPWTSMEELLAECFRAAAHSDATTGFLHYQRLMHSESVEAPQSLTHLEVFQWKKLRDRFSEYLENPADPTSFKIVRRVPERVAENDRVCKVFVKSTIREPVPTRFRRDARLGGAWRIETSSL